MGYVTISCGRYIHQDIQDDEIIYKFMKLEHLKELLGTNTLFFQKIIDWDDTWEFPSRYIMKPTIGKESEYWHRSADIFQNYLYGCCFTRAYNSDAMQRIYSHDKSGVCIKTSAKKLYESVFDSIEPAKPEKSLEYDACIAPVYYADTTENALENIYSPEQVAKYPSHMYTAYFKRNFFKHEDEIRIVLLNHKRNQEKFLKFPLTKQFIDEIILDSRIDEYKLQSYERSLNQYGIKITKSDLYNRPRFDAERFDEISEQLTNEVYKYPSQNHSYDLMSLHNERYTNNNK